MTLPLTRPPRGDAGHDARPRPSPGRPGGRGGRGCGGTGRVSGGGSGARRWQERNPLSRAWATSPRGAAVLLAVCALFAGAVAVFSTNPPERLWGIMAAGPYGLAALAALLAGRRGRRIAVAVSLAGAVIVPLAWMAWTGRAQPEVGVVIHSAGLFLHDGTPYQAAPRRGHRAQPVRLQPVPASLGRVRGPARPLRRRPAHRSAAVVRGGVRTRVRGHAGPERCAAALAVDGGGHRLAHHRVPAHHGRGRPARTGPDLRGPGPAADQPGTAAGAADHPGRAWSWAWPRP